MNNSFASLAVPLRRAVLGGLGYLDGLARDGRGRDVRRAGPRAVPVEEEGAEREGMESLRRELRK